jgi:hypothetical protein
VLSEGSLSGMRKRSLEWLSKVRSVVAVVPREYRLIGAFDSAVVFLGEDGGYKKGERDDLDWLEGPGRNGGRRREEEGRVVGKWEVKRGGTTSLCILWTRGGSGGEGGN